MKKYLLACGILAYAFFVQTQNGFAYSTVHEGCTTCHIKKELHDVSGHTPCTGCHVDPAGAQDVAPAKCAACHPAGNPGECSLVKLHVRVMKNCASCHARTASATGIGIATAGPSCTSCHTDCTSACPAARLLGEEDSRLETLTRLRDTVLAKNALGRKFIRIYYDNAESVNAALENNPKLKSFSYRALTLFIPIAELFM